MILSVRRLFVFCLSLTILLLVTFHFKSSRQHSKLGEKAIIASSSISNDENVSSVNILPSFLANTFSSKQMIVKEMIKRDEQCPEESPLLQGNLRVSFKDNQNYSGNWPPTFEEIALDNPDLELGGYNPDPSNCKARNSIAVIVPYRDREEHLRFFLHYIHLILQRQQTRYVIYVVEQDDDNTFNKGQLMNAGFLYATNNSTLNISCIFFHDVDIISEDDRTLYRCRDKSEVVHLAMRIDQLNYKFCCGLTVGGILGFTMQQFTDVNGYSNSYYGWGAEDDDMFYRIREIGKLAIYRPAEEFQRFKMIKHQRDGSNRPNPMRLELLNKWKSRQPHDGINSLDAPISKVIKYPTHTRLYVKVKPQS